MQLSTDSYFIIALLTGLLGLMVAALLIFVNKSATLYSRLLAAFLACFSLLSIKQAVSFTNVVYKPASLEWIFFCVAPLGYLYVRSALQQSSRLQRVDLLLLMPALLYMLFSLPVYLLPQVYQLASIKPAISGGIVTSAAPEEILSHNSLATASIVLYSMIVLAAQLILLKKYKKKVFNAGKITKQQEETFKWLVLFSVILLTMYLSVSIELGFHLLGVYNPIGLLLSATILFICVALFIRPEILYGIPGSFLQAQEFAVTPYPALIIPDALPQPQKQLIASNQEIFLKSALEDHFKNQQPFKKSGYTLSELSKELNITSHQLSAFINQGYGKNFSELVNEHRVKYLSGLLKSSPEYFQFTLEALGREAGFNSRTAFINAVKKNTGMTPSEFFGRKSECILN